MVLPSLAVRNYAVRAAGALLTLLMLMSACSSDGSTAVDVSRLVPTAAPTTPPPPTTEPVLVQPDPGPTPITLAGGQGIAAPVPGSEDESESGDYNEAALADETTSDETVDPDRADEADETTDGATTDGDDPADGDPAGDGYNESALADEAATPEPTTAPQATSAPAPTSPPAAAAPPAPTAVPVQDVGSPQSIANGAEVFALECARCHGARGEGVITSPMLFVGRRYTPTSLVNELTNGHPFTFGFADKLSATEISNVVDYVLSEFS